MSRIKQHFWIKGDDGEEYGPADLTEVNEWVRENRMGADTPVRPESAEGQDEAVWRPAEEVPEIAALLLILREERKRRRQEQPAAGLPLADFWQRAVAAILDVLIIFLISNLFSSLCALVYPETFDPEKMTALLNEGYMPKPMVFLLAAFCAIFVGFFAIFHGLSGQTPGKRLLGIRLVDDAGLTPTFTKALLRALVELASLLFITVFGHLVALFTPHRRALHDIIARTVVVKVRKPDY